MKTNLLKRLSSSKGFTLIELLVVIAIIGVLAAAVLVAINPGQRIAATRNARIRSDLNNMGNAANIFNTDMGLNPNCIGGGSYPSLLAVPPATAQSIVCAIGNPAITYMLAPVAPTSVYTLEKTPGACVPNTATPCTAIALQGPAYSDGVIDATSNNIWCWRSSSGQIAQTTDALCLP
jgi:type IV pilus assembly protein PilA